MGRGGRHGLGWAWASMIRFLDLFDVCDKGVGLGGKTRFINERVSREKIGPNGVRPKARGNLERCSKVCGLGLGHNWG